MDNRISQRQHSFMFVIVLALLFLFMITPASVAVTSHERQRGIEIAESHQILFDDDFDLLDCIHLDGEEYYIIKQKNFFLFANRLDIYRSDGHIVENYNLSKSIFEVYAWKQQTDKLKAMDRGDLRGVLTTSGNIGSTAAPLHRVTGTVVSAIDEAKSVKIGDIYVWDTATKIKPELKSFENTMRSFNKEVGEWDSASSSVNANLPSVIEGLESMDRGEEIDWTGFAYSTKASVGAFNELSVKTGQMSYRVSSVREKLKEVNRGLGSVGGGLLAGAFGEMDGKLGSVQDSIDGYTSRLNRYSREFNEISEDVERIEGKMEGGWKKSLDKEAALKLIYCLLGFIFIGIVITILTLLTDFRKRLKEGTEMADSITSGIVMFMWSSSVGCTLVILFIFHIITAWIFKWLFYHDFELYPWYLTTKIPFVIPYSISAYQVCIFLIYFAGVIILFATINGSLTKVKKVECTLPTSIGNYVVLVLIFMMTVLNINYMHVTDETNLALVFIMGIGGILLIVVGVIALLLTFFKDYAYSSIFLLILAAIGFAAPALGAVVAIIMLPQILIRSIIMPMLYHRYESDDLLIACSVLIPLLYSIHYIYYNAYKIVTEFVLNDAPIYAAVYAIIGITIPCIIVTIIYDKGTSIGESIMQEWNNQKRYNASVSDIPV